MKTILKGKEWHTYMKNAFKSGILNDQMKSYSGTTYKFRTVWKAGDYFYCFDIRRGYLKLSSLKRAITLLGY